MHLLKYLSVLYTGTIIEILGILFSNTFLSSSDVVIYKENRKSQSYCNKQEKFDYHGIENALIGNMYPNRFTPKRIIVIQMR